LNSWSSNIDRSPRFLQINIIFAPISFFFRWIYFFILVSPTFAFFLSTSFF
jgi:hypothetical protein